MEEWKDLYWYLHRSINNASAYIAVWGNERMCTDDKAYFSVHGMKKGCILLTFQILLHTRRLAFFFVSLQENKHDALWFLLFCCPASTIQVIYVLLFFFFVCLCVYQQGFCQLPEFLSVHSVASLTPVPPAPLPAMAELGNMQPRSKTTSIPYYQESAHCRSQGFNLFVPVSAQD